MPEAMPAARLYTDVERIYNSIQSELEYVRRRATGNLVTKKREDFDQALDILEKKVRPLLKELEAAIKERQIVY